MDEVRRDPFPLHPIAVIEDRYGGSYAGGRWLAIANADEEVDGVLRAAWCLDENMEGPHGDDIDAMEFWGPQQPRWIAVGQTPDEAIANLRVRMEEEEEVLHAG